MSKQNAISPTRAEDYPEWYQQVVTAADLAENSPVRGCMIIKPWGYAIWENMQAVLDGMFKETGHVNAYFPLLIPLSFFEKEAEHVAGFAKECAVVTHHRLETTPEGRLIPAGELEEPLIIRPTSETMINTSFAKWVQSYRDLPILMNQWCNIMRWEMRTRMFLRTSEFLWQEGHTAHATADEAHEETRKMLGVYTTFARDYVGLPVIPGEKTAEERFPGADHTFTIEAMMQDRKALQAGTSHFLGQNFAKAFEIKFTDQKGELQHAWTTSWGMTTRMIGALIMTHADDDGLVLPPRIAPQHIVIIPVIPNENDRAAVTEYVLKLKAELQAQKFDDRPIKVHVDLRDMRGGDKAWEHIKKGVPIRLEVGPRDIGNDQVFMGRRDLSPKDKKSLPRSEFVTSAAGILQSIQDNLLQRALTFREENTHVISERAAFEKFFAEDQPGGFAKCYVDLSFSGIEEIIKPLKVTARCIPLEQPSVGGKCVFSGKETGTVVIFAKAY
jgi:prolyl-tRNA synthetase